MTRMETRLAMKDMCSWQRQPKDTALGAADSAEECKRGGQKPCTRAWQWWCHATRHGPSTHRINSTGTAETLTQSKPPQEDGAAEH